MGTANTYVCTSTYVVTGNGQNDVTELQYTLSDRYTQNTCRILLHTMYFPECNFGMACHSTRPA